MKLFGEKSENEKVFICYRRDDTSGYAGRLSDSLTAYFGPDRVYMDLKDPKYAADYKESIGEQLSASGAVLVLIGEEWVSITDKDGNRRLYNPDDDVAREINVALESKLTVLPVLVGGAVMPRADELPEQLRELSRRNAISLSDDRWHTDVDRLAKVVSFDVPSSAAQQVLDASRLWAITMIVVMTTITLISFLNALPSWKSGDGLDAGGFTPLICILQFMAIVFAGARVGGKAAELMEKSIFAHGARVLAWSAAAITIVYYTLDNSNRPDISLMITFASSMLTALGVLALMCLAGFKAN